MVWEIAGLPLPVSLRAWQVLLVPSVVELDGGHVLAFDPVLEDLDFKRVPGLYRIIDAINEGVASQRRKLAWNLSRALSVRTSLMRTRIVPEATFTLAPVSATVAVTASEVRLDATLEARIRRDVTPAASLRSACARAIRPSPGPSPVRGPAASMARTRRPTRASPHERA
jgi:hypothetical protein